MIGQASVDQPTAPVKINLKDIDFDNIDDNDLRMTREEIDIILNIREIKGERMEHIKNQIAKEKEELRRKMLKELKKEKENIITSYKKEAEYSDSDEIVSTPKSKITRTKK